MAVYESPIADTFGGFLIGVFISLIMYGVIISQCMTYYERYHKDPSWIKCYVGIILLFDTASTWFAVQLMYDMFVLNWGNLERFTYGGWLLAVDPILTGIIAFLVQVFFAWRVKVVTSNSWFCTLIISLATINILGACGTGIALLWVRSYSRFSDFRPIAVIWLASSAVADIVITIILSHYLRSRRTDLEKTNRLLRGVMRLTIQNGLLTSLTALADITIYLILSKPYHVSLSFIIPKLYCNTVLSSLNARDVGKDEWTGGTNFVDLIIIPDSATDRLNHAGPSAESTSHEPPRRGGNATEPRKPTDLAKGVDKWATRGDISCNV